MNDIMHKENSTRSRRISFSRNLTAAATCLYLLFNSLQAQAQYGSDMGDRGRQSQRTGSQTQHAGPIGAGPRNTNARGGPYERAERRDIGDGDSNNERSGQTGGGGGGGGGGGAAARPGISGTGVACVAAEAADKFSEFNIDPSMAPIAGGGRAKRQGAGQKKSGTMASLFGLGACLAPVGTLGYGARTVRGCDGNFANILKNFFQRSANHPGVGANPDALVPGLPNAAADKKAKDARPLQQRQGAQSQGAGQSAGAANTAAEIGHEQADSAITYVGSYLRNFTSDAGNKWNQVRDKIFVPIGILLLLPGALITQMRAIMATSNPVLGNVNPLEGIYRSMVAVFLLPATYLVMNYGIDIANSITLSIADQYQQIFGSDMYEDAVCAEIKAMPFRLPEENRNTIDMPKSSMGEILVAKAPTPFAKLEAALVAVKIWDPCVGIYIVPPDRADEVVPSAVHAARLMCNTSNCSLVTAWNVLCAFQVAFLYYLWCVGPVVAGLWTWPMKQLRDALPNWIEGVVTLCFWSLFWNTVVFLMAAFRGVDETGTLIMLALNSLACLSVKYAFDFAGLARGVGQQIQKLGDKFANTMHQEAKKNKKGGGGGGKGGGKGGGPGRGPGRGPGDGTPPPSPGGEEAPAPAPDVVNGPTAAPAGPLESTHREDMIPSFAMTMTESLTTSGSTRGPSIADRVATELAGTGNSPTEAHRRTGEAYERAITEAIAARLRGPGGNDLALQYNSLRPEERAAWVQQNIFGGRTIDQVIQAQRQSGAFERLAGLSGPAANAEARSLGRIAAAVLTGGPVGTQNGHLTARFIDNDPAKGIVSNIHYYRNLAAGQSARSVERRDTPKVAATATAPASGGVAIRNVQTYRTAQEAQRGIAQLDQPALANAPTRAREALPPTAGNRREEAIARARLVPGATTYELDGVSHPLPPVVRHRDGTMERDGRPVSQEELNAMMEQLRQKAIAENQQHYHHPVTGEMISVSRSRSAYDPHHVPGTVASIDPVTGRPRTTAADDVPGTVVRPVRRDRGIPGEGDPTVIHTADASGRPIQPGQPILRGEVRHSRQAGDELNVIATPEDDIENRLGRPGKEKPDDTMLATNDFSRGPTNLGRAGLEDDPQMIVPAESDYDPMDPNQQALKGQLETNMVQGDDPSKLRQDQEGLQGNLAESEPGLESQLGMFGQPGQPGQPGIPGQMIDPITGLPINQSYEAGLNMGGGMLLSENDPRKQQQDHGLTPELQGHLQRPQPGQTGYPPAGYPPTGGGQQGQQQGQDPKLARQEGQMPGQFGQPPEGEDKTVFVPDHGLTPDLGNIKGPDKKKLRNILGDAFGRMNEESEDEEEEKDDDEEKDQPDPNPNEPPPWAR